MMTPEARRETEKTITELEEIAKRFDDNAALLPTTAAALHFYNMAAENRQLARAFRAALDETPTPKNEVQ
jgi:hypothetical protein